MRYFVELLVVAAVMAEVNAAAELTTIWTTRLGPLQPQTEGVYRTAVCGDGSAYFVDGLNRVAAVSASGQLLYDGEVGLAKTFAISCDPSGHLIAINGEFFSTWRLKGSSRSSLEKLTEISVKSLALMPSKIIDTPSGLYIIGKTRSQQQTTSAKILHRMDRTGRHFASMELGQHPTDLSAAEATLSMRRGAFAWDPDLGTLAFALANPFELRLFDANSQQVSAPTRPVGTFAPLRIEGSGAPAWTDRIVDMTYSSGLGFVVQSIEREGSSGKKRSFLTVLSPQTLEVRSRIPLKGSGVSGFLQGSSRDGLLYFQSVAPDTGIQLSAVRLVLTK